jgi:hypothetical protein
MQPTNRVPEAASGRLRGALEGRATIFGANVHSASSARSASARRLAYCSEARGRASSAMRCSRDADAHREAYGWHSCKPAAACNRPSLWPAASVEDMQQVSTVQRTHISQCAGQPCKPSMGTTSPSGREASRTRLSRMRCTNTSGSIVPRQAHCRLPSRCRRATGTPSAPDSPLRSCCALCVPSGPSAICRTKPCEGLYTEPSELQMPARGALCNGGLSPLRDAGASACSRFAAERCPAVESTCGAPLRPRRSDTKCRLCAAVLATLNRLWTSSNAPSSSLGSRVDSLSSSAASTSIARGLGGAPNGGAACGALPQRAGGATSAAGLSAASVCLLDGRRGLVPRPRSVGLGVRRVMAHARSPLPLVRSPSPAMLPVLDGGDSSTPGAPGVRCCAAVGASHGGGLLRNPADPARDAAASACCRMRLSTSAVRVGVGRQDARCSAICVRSASSRSTIARRLAASSSLMCRGSARCRQMVQHAGRWR